MISGIFLDEMANETHIPSFYRDIYHIKALPRCAWWATRAGPYRRVCWVTDAIVGFEGAATTFRTLTHASAWLYPLTNNRHAMLVHNATRAAMQTAVQAADLARYNAGLVYARTCNTTRHRVGSPWASLPTYWRIAGGYSARHQHRHRPSRLLTSQQKALPAELRAGLCQPVRLRSPQPAQNRLAEFVGAPAPQRSRGRPQ